MGVAPAAASSTIRASSSTAYFNSEMKQESSVRKIKPGRKKLMTRKSVRIAALAAPVLIGMLLLFAGSSSVTASDQPANDQPASDQPSVASAAVKIDNFVFGPQTITVAVGTTVTWTNSDDIPHTAVSTDGVFKSKVMDTDEKFSYTFTKPGTYSYYCTIHPKMTGKVLVQ
jgi:plastocyanin